MMPQVMMPRALSGFRPACNRPHIGVLDDTIHGVKRGVRSNALFRRHDGTVVVTGHRPLKFVSRSAGVRCGRPGIVVTPHRILDFVATPGPLAFAGNFGQGNNFWSPAFVSQDLNDLESMLGAANLFGSNAVNYFDFDFGVDVINPSVVIGTYPAGQPFYSTWYPTFSLRGIVTDMEVRPAVVPLPAGVWLVGSAVGLMAGRMRRRA